MGNKIKAGLGKCQRGLQEPAFDAVRNLICVIHLCQEFFMKYVLITGGSRGIGASTAAECARRGFGVILTWSSKQDADSQVVKHIQAAGGHALALQLNVEDTSSFSQFRSVLEDAMESRWGARGLHGLVNNAGYVTCSPLINTPRC